MSLFDDPKPVKRGKKNLWEKKRYEQVQHYQWFTDYLSMADRSIAKVAEKHNLQESFVKGIAEKNEWFARAAAFDYQNLNKDTGLEAEIILSKDASIQDMTDKHMLIAGRAQKVALAGFALLENYVKEYTFSVNSEEEAPKKPALSADDVVKMARFGTELERLSLGQATKITETKKQDYDKLSDEELENLARLLDKAEGENADD